MTNRFEIRSEITSNDNFQFEIRDSRFARDWESLEYENGSNEVIYTSFDASINRRPQTRVISFQEAEALLKARRSE